MSDCVGLFIRTVEARGLPVFDEGELKGRM